ncbi:redoxin domain-containing protein [Lysinimonas soli]|uniref:Redoxin domain-containing protein n=1 Tax=Lysinimonas soli TaxID=1074233 RepID=A0ABW0NU73_9MICO
MRVAPWVFAAAGGVLVVGVLIAAALGGAPAPSFGAGLSEADSSLVELQQTSAPAPDFSLTDQNGHHVDLTEFRGRPVVLTFNDDECTDLCTLLAQDVIAADQDLGADASKIAFVSINANPFHTAVADVRGWTRQHALGTLHNWYYGTASRAGLADIAKRYGCDIEADAATGTVSHCTTIYFIDPSGQERAIGGFGSDSANTRPFARAMAQMAADLATSTIHVAGSPLANPAGRGTALGDRAPSLTLPELSGDPSPPSQGGYRVIDFWSSTCSACRTELPALEREHVALGSAVDFIGVDVDDTASAGRSFTAAVGATFRSLRDPDGSTAGTWQVTGLPYLVIVDPQGKIVVRHPGAMTQEQLDYILRDLDVELAPAS